MLIPLENHVILTYGENTLQILDEPVTSWKEYVAKIAAWNWGFCLEIYQSNVSRHKDCIGVFKYSSSVLSPE